MKRNGGSVAHKKAESLCRDFSKGANGVLARGEPFAIAFIARPAGTDADRTDTRQPFSYST